MFRVSTKLGTNSGHFAGIIVNEMKQRGSFSSNAPFSAFILPSHHPKSE